MGYALIEDCGTLSGHCKQYKLGNDPLRYFKVQFRIIKFSSEFQSSVRYSKVQFCNSKFGSVIQNSDSHHWRYLPNVIFVQFLTYYLLYALETLRYWNFGTRFLLVRSSIITDKMKLTNVFGIINIIRFLVLFNIIKFILK